MNRRDVRNVQAELPVPEAETPRACQRGSARKRELRRLLEGAIELEENARSIWLAAQTVDSALREEVLALLAEEDHGFLAQTAMERLIEAIAAVTE